MLNFKRACKYNYEREFFFSYNGIIGFFMYMTKILHFSSKV